MDNRQIDAIESRARAYPYPFVTDIRTLAKEARRRIELERTIPVRLSGNRRAYLALPDPLTAEDAEHIKLWIDLQVSAPDLVVTQDSQPAK